MGTRTALGKELETVATSKDKKMERIFSKIASQIPKLPMGEYVRNYFKKHKSAKKVEVLLNATRN